MHFSGQFQLAYITGDMDAAVRLCRERFGADEFEFVDAELPVQARGESGVVRMQVALAWIGHRQIELIRPESGLVDMYSEFLPVDAPLRFHHIGMRCDDLDRVRDEAANQGVPTAMAGSSGPIDFLYLDTRDSLGHYLEYISTDAGTWAGMGWPVELPVSR